ncbi:hypothetical protein [Rhizobium rhizogenes]|uniref:hypothetical protein n=1 Tax=Rhizobium rhizogenes TaxID=359 RepID=UPI0015744DBD|nr:hypothetical protein [Rhizobium rhizogenes]NTF67721.1 hypothetical protein [Rhizobium rhizogenes]
MSALHQTTTMEEALLSDDPVTRIVARAHASTWFAAFNEWLNSEKHRGENPTDIILATMELNIKIHSSIAALFLEPTGWPLAVTTYHEYLDALYIRHAAAAANSLARQRR